MQAVSKLATWRSLTKRQLRESDCFVQAALFLLAASGFVLAMAQRKRTALRLLMRVHRAARRPWLRGIVERYVVRNRALLHAQGATQMRAPGLFEKNRLLVLKPPLGNGESGVLLVMFNETIDQLYAAMDLERLLHDYTLVLEPSYPGYCNPSLLQYSRFAEDIFVLAPVREDFAFLARLRNNLIPVDLGPCDWVDPSVCEPYLTAPKEFDIVMNAIWASLKRHASLFRMLARAKRRYNVALIGVEWDGRVRSDVEREARYYGVHDQITFFESVSYKAAIETMCKARVSVLLSLKEAGPRALAESMFCDVPVVALRRLTGGIVKNIVPETGVLTAENRLEAAVEYVMSAAIKPRQWAVEHISCFHSSQRLNDVLRARAISDCKPWTQDIAVRSNSPECVHVFPEDAARLRRYSALLPGYLKS